LTYFPFFSPFFRGYYEAGLGFFFAYTDTPLSWAIDLVLEENHLLGHYPLRWFWGCCRVWEYYGVLFIYFSRIERLGEAFDVERIVE
jgi:hypothetical protein